VKRAKIDDVALSIADMVRPTLVMDGMFLVGLDIVGDKIMEINVFSPGGLGSAEEFEETDFTRPIIEAMERKVQYVSHSRRGTENAVISML
jgi:glutathione synthase